MLSSGNFMSSDPVAVLVFLLDQVAGDLGAAVVTWGIPLQIGRLLIVVNNLEVAWRT